MSSHPFTHSRTLPPLSQSCEIERNHVCNPISTTLIVLDAAPILRVTSHIYHTITFHMSIMTRIIPLLMHCATTYRSKREFSP
jgi:hypothetical protein